MGVFKGEWVGDDDAVEALLFWFRFLNTLTTFLIDMAATGYDLDLRRAVSTSRPMREFTRDNAEVLW